MDLFGDLPPPSDDAKQPEKTSKGEKGGEITHRNHNISLLRLLLLGSGMSLFDDLPAENASPANKGGGVASERKRSSCDSLNDDAPSTKLPKTWGM